MGNGRAAGPIVLHRSGPEMRLDGPSAAALTEAWHAQHYLRLPGLLDPDLLAVARDAVRDAAAFRPQRWEVGDEHLLPDSAAVRLLDFLLNDGDLLRAIRDLTGCHDIGWFKGRIYRLLPGSGESHTWHSDVMHGRRVALSINLSGQAFEGGELLLRDAASEQVLAEIGNRAEGDGVLFRVHEDLEHRVLPVAGEMPRTAFAGWFTAGPGLAEQLHALMPPSGPK